jgi:hypothetical protein
MNIIESTIRSECSVTDLIDDSIDDFIDDSINDLVDENDNLSLI